MLYDGETSLSQALPPAPKTFEVVVSALHDDREYFSTCLSANDHRTMRFQVVSNLQVMERGLIEFDGGLSAYKKHVLESFAKCHILPLQSPTSSSSEEHEIKITIHSGTVRMCLSLAGPPELVHAAIAGCPEAYEALSVISEGRAKAYRFVDKPGPLKEWILPRSSDRP